MKPQAKPMLIALLSCGVAGYALLQLIVPRLVDEAAMRQEIETGLEAATGINFHIRSLRLQPTLFHGIQIRLSQSALSDLQLHSLGDIAEIVVQVRYLPLLTRQTPEISKIRIRHVRVPVGPYNLFKLLKIKAVKPKKTGFLNPAEVRNAEVLLEDYLIDDSGVARTTRDLLPGARSFRMGGDHLSVQHLASSHPLAIEAKGQYAFFAVPLPSPDASPLQQGHYHFRLELPRQSVLEKGAMTPQLLRQAELHLTGADLNLHLRYQNPNGPQGEARFDPSRLSLANGEALILQLANTLGVPLPPAARQFYVTGHAQLDPAFQIGFAAGQTPRLSHLGGQMRLQSVALGEARAWPAPIVRRLNGVLGLEENRVNLQNLSLQFQNQPVWLQGLYEIDTERIQAQAQASRLDLQAIQRLTAASPAVKSALRGKTIQGRVDLRTTVTGTLSQPVYRGQVALKDGLFADAAHGVKASQLNGDIHFDGQGREKPVVAYQGKVQVDHGQYINRSQGIAVQRFDGRLAFQGRFDARRPQPALPALPAYEGQVRVQQARYEDPKTHLPVEGIRGLIRLADQQVFIQHFRALLGGSELTAEGKATPNLKQPEKSAYQVRITGNAIHLPRFQREVLAKLPPLQSFQKNLRANSGNAAVDVTLSTGLNARGKVRLTGLVLQTSQPRYPLQAEDLTVLFAGRQVTVPTARLRYGDIPAQVSARYLSPQQYEAKLATGAVPMSFLRDQQPLINRLSSLQLPEIWNTQGDMTLNAAVSNQSRTAQLAFNQAGLSWQGGDFPLANLTGQLRYQQAGQAAPRLSGEALSFRYGNSPVNITFDPADAHHITLNGALSALTVNHFLVSHQSNAAPYQEVPFQAALTFPPGQPDALSAQLHLDLNPNFRNQPAVAAAEPNAAAAAEEAQMEAKEAANDLAEAPENAPAAQQAAETGKDKLPLKLNPVKAITGVVGIAKQTAQQGLNVITAVPRKLLPGEVTQSPQVAPEYAPQLPPATEEGSAYLDARLRLEKQSLFLDGLLLHLFNGGNVLGDGYVGRLTDDSRRLVHAHVYTQPSLSLEQLSRGTGDNPFFRGMKGTVAADVTYDGEGSFQKAAWGSLVLDHVAVPHLTVQELTGKMLINGEAATADVAAFKIPGLSTGLSARTDNLFEVPVTLEDVRIGGSLLSIDSLSAFNEQVVKPILVDQVAHNFARPWQQGDPTIPIQFRNGDVHFDETIFQNIIMSNLNSKMAVYANSFTELSRTTLEAAGGTANGYLSMSPNTANFMTLELNADNIKANALTKALLNVTNQVFGDLSGTVRFTTFGATDEQMQQNANGTVTMSIKNGRLPAIAKVETLLSTANVLRGGILGLNLNNLLRSLSLRDTNYFATLKGDMLINNQVLYTQNLISDGVNLDLQIQGSMRMDNGSANMLVNGSMSQDVAGKLGALGKLSLGRVVRYVPGVGTFGKNQPGLLGYIPGVGYVPGFGGPAGEFNKFQVRLTGPLEEASSIQDFHWVK